MKRKVLLMSTAMLAALSASAQNFTAEWKPADPLTQFKTFAAEDTVYLYNVKSRGFYTAHPNTASPTWGTRAMANDTLGQKVVFTRTNPGGADDADTWASDGCLDNTYLLVSWVPKFSEFRCTFADGWNGIWTDNNTNLSRYFNVVPAEDGAFKIEGNTLMNGSETYTYEGKYLGVAPSKGDNLIYLHDTETEGALTEEDEFYDEWKAVDPAVYETYIAASKSQNALYNAAMSLKETIQHAYDTNPGISLDAQIAVYNNTASTVEELNAAQASIAKAIVDFIASKATIDNPVDFTSALTNPDFSTGDATGWKGSPTVDKNYKNCEVFNKNFDVYQVLDYLPKGVYEIGIQAFYRAGGNQNEFTNYKKDPNANNNARLYAQTKKYGEFSTPALRAASAASETGYFTDDTGNWPYDAHVTDEEGNIYFTPNSMQGAEQWFNAGEYKTNFCVGVDEADTLQVGFKKETTIGDDWCIFDNFTLKYYGSSLEAYKKWGNSTAEGASIGDLENQDPETAVYYSKPEYEKYKAALSTMKNGSSVEEIVEAIKSLSVATDSVNNSASYYKKYIAKLQEIDKWLTEGEDKGLNMDTPAVAWIADYLQSETSADTDISYPNGVAHEILDYENEVFGGSLDNATLLAEMDTLEKKYQEAISTGLVEGSDLTALLTNPGFEEADGKGWKLDTSKGGTNQLTNWHGGNSNNYAAEAYQQLFDVYQEVSDLPEGLYKVSVQAFYRTADNATAWTAYQNDPEMTGDAKVYAEVYFNSFSKPVKNVMEVQFADQLTDPSGNAIDMYTTTDGTYTLNNMSGASAAFSLDDESQNFTQNVYGLIGADKKMRVGIRRLAGATNNQSWTLWDNFKITYMGKNVEALKEVIEEYTNRANALADATYGDEEKNNLEKAIEAGSEGTTGDELYTALNDLVEAYNNANTSVDLYKQLDEANTKLTEAIDNYQDTASDESLENATELTDEVSEFGTSGNIAAVTALIKRINAAIAQLRIPDTTGASDDSPIDVTSAIVNPTFDTIGDFTGWSSGFGAGGTTAECAEVYNSNFNVYQDIVGLPAGTYEVRVNGFNRTTGNTNNAAYNEWLEGTADKALTTYLYGLDNPEKYALDKDADHAATATIKHIMAGVRTENDLGGSQVGTTGNELYAPNSMADAVAFFHATDGDGNPLNSYNVGAFVNVTEDTEGSGTGTLRIGVYKQDNPLVANSWCIFDDFQLFYYGNASKHGQDKNAVNINGVNTTVSGAAAGIYNLNGARVNALQKGLNIVKTVDAEGKVTVKKIFVK